MTSPQELETYREAVSFDGAAIAYQAIGSGPPLLVVPGGPRDSAYLEDLGGLSRTRTLIRYDARGTGHSAAPQDTAKYAFPSLARDVDALRQVVDAPSVDILGHSAGAIVAAVYAAHHRDRVGKLVLVAPGPQFFGGGEDVPALLQRRSGEPWFAQASAAAARLAAPQPSDTPQEILELLIRYTPAAYGAWGPRQQAHAATQHEQFALQAWQHFDGDGQRTAPERFLPLLSAVDVPVLVITGDGDALTGVSAGAAAAGHFPAAEHISLRGAGHYPWVDSPEEFVSTVEAFLAR